MRLVSFEVITDLGPMRRIGVLYENEVLDLQAAYAAYLRDEKGLWGWRRLAAALVPTEMLEFIEGGDMSKEAAQVALEFVKRAGNAQTDSHGQRLLYPTEGIRMLAPVPRPIAFRDCSAFLQHISNMSGIEKQDLPEMWYKRPAHYRTNTMNVVGPDDPIVWPSYTEKLDFELEFAACIGRHGINIPAEKGEEYIFGYTIFNDISARDIQNEEMTLHHGPTKGKSFCNSNVMGPCLVTADELDSSHLNMTARINGEVWCVGNSSTMQFSFPQLVSYLSLEDPLYPGEFIGSGTVGFGCGAELNRWIKPGDVIELEVEGIGVLRNEVVRKT